jgi:Lon protease-like protein
VSRLVEIPVFPLSNVVLFPRVQAPLHLFEPRYRQMAEQALAGGRQIGMVAVPPEHVDELPGDPPVYGIGCSGVLAQSQRLPDGRYNIILSGTQRFRIISEPPRPGGQLFRTAEIEPLDDPFPPAEKRRVADLRERIVGLVRRLVERTDSNRSQQVTPALFSGVDDVAFVNSLSNALTFSPPEKQGLLEAASIPARFDRLEGLLSFRLAELSRPGVAGSGSLH